jgi:hypothetical protein
MKRYQFVVHSLELVIVRVTFRQSAYVCLLGHQLVMNEKRTHDFCGSDRLAARARRARARCKVR